MSAAEKGSPTVVEESSWQQSKYKFNNKGASEYHDPCQDFANRSIKCMHRNGGDRDMCSDYFQAYRDCKKAWLAEKKFSNR